MSNADTFDEARDYRVKLRFPVTYRGATLLPLNPHDMTGAALNVIVSEHGADAIDAAEEV